MQRINAPTRLTQDELKFLKSFDCSTNEVIRMAVNMQLKDDYVVPLNNLPRKAHVTAHVNKDDLNKLLAQGIRLNVPNETVSKAIHRAIRYFIQNA